MAHSGKCATRLAEDAIRNSGGGDEFSKPILDALRCRFISGYGGARGIKPSSNKLDILSVFVLVVECICTGGETGLDLPNLPNLPTAIEFRNSRILTMASNNTKKYSRN